MAKLFKTISLVERLEASPYGKGPVQPPQNTNQGAVDLKNTTAPRKSSPIELKKIDDATKRNAELIKLIQNTRPDYIPPIPSPLTTKPLSTFVIPKPNYKFAKTMQLEDRLKQSNKVESTRHLPQFYLSDIYTDYITISKFGIFNHESSVDVRQFVAAPEKGGTTINVTEFDSLIRQGTRYTNGRYISLTPTTRPVESVLVSQGTFFTNGAFISQATISTPVADSDNFIKQGGTLVKGSYKSVIDTSRPIGIQNQGGLNPSKAVSANTTRLLQGLLIDNSGELKSFVKPQDPIQLGNPANQSPLLPQPKFATQIVNQGSIVLKTNEYQGDRALSILLPRIKHGSASLQRINFTSETFNQGEAILPVKDFQNTTINNQTVTKAQGEDWFAINRPAIGNTPISQLLSNELDPNQAKSLLRGSILGWQYDRTDGRQGTAPTGNVRVVDQRIPSAWSSTTNSPKPGKTTRGSLGVTPDGEGSDFIPLIITSVTQDATTLQFKALLTSLSDSFSPTWNDYNYVGRQDTVKSFKGITRSISLGFKVVAWGNRETASTLFQRLETLAKITTVGVPNSKGYIEAPLILAVVGNILNGALCACTSLKYDFNPAEYSWDVEKGLPMLADVSMELAILTDNNQKLFNAKTNKYYNY